MARPLVITQRYILDLLARIYRLIEDGELVRNTKGTPDAQERFSASQAFINTLKDLRTVLELTGRAPIQKGEQDDG